MRKKLLYVVFIIGIFCIPVTGFSFEWVELTNTTNDDLRDVWGTSANNIYAVGGHDTTILYYDGAHWTDLEDHLPVTAIADTHGIWGSSSTNIFAVGGWSYYGVPRGSILHHNGTVWQSLSDQPNSLVAWINQLHGIWGTSAADIYGVGERNYALFSGWVGPLMHYDGSSISEMDNPREIVSGSDLFDIWGTSSEDVYAVGNVINEACINIETICIFWDLICWDVCTEYATYNHSNVMYCDGKEWTHVETGVDADLFSIWGSASNNIFAVGESGTILHYDGSQWAQMTSGTTFDLRGVWGTSEGAVYAVG